MSPSDRNGYAPREMKKMSERMPPGLYFWEPAERGSLCVIRFKAPHYTGAGEVIARNVELRLAKRMVELLNADANPQG